MTLARALLGPVTLSLDSLASMLGTDTRKASNDDFAREIDEEFLSYARSACNSGHMGNLPEIA